MKIKGFMFISLIIWMFIIISFPVLAGDIPESALLSADYCFIGEVKNIEDSYTTLKIHQVVFGKYQEDEIKIYDLKYTESFEKLSLPKVGDYCAIVVEESNDEYIVYERLAAKSNSLDRETLKLKSSNEFIKRMNDYINSGHYSNQSIENVNSKINKGRESANGSETSTPIRNETINVVEMVDENNSNVTEQNSKHFEGFKINFWFISAIVVLIVTVCVFVIIKKRKRKI